MHPRTASHIAAARTELGALLASISDAQLVKLVGAVGDQTKAVSKVRAAFSQQAVNALLGTTIIPTPPVPAAKPVIVNRSTSETLAAEYADKAPAKFERHTDRLVDTLEVVDIWIDDAKVGCGRRRFILVERCETGKREFVRLFYPGNLTTVEVDGKYYDKHGTLVPNRKVNRAHVADVIRRNIAMADKLNAGAAREVMYDGGRYAPHALKLITPN